LPSDEKREAKLRRNLKGWGEDDGEWLLRRYGFDERRRRPTSHRQFVHPVSKVHVTLYVHGSELLRDVADSIIKQVDKSEQILASGRGPDGCN
jgi:predicted RNA binding protein YcfA (HicA-like mRNA interferase family)